MSNFRSTKWGFAFLSTLMLSAAITLAYHELSTSRSNTITSFNVPRTVDLGYVGTGKVIPAKIPLSNSGSDTIYIDKFETDCTCMSVYEIRDGFRTNINSFQIPPNTTQEIYVDVKISGDTGIKQASSLTIITGGEPNIYNIGVVYTPVATLYALPKHVGFGDIATNAISRKRVELRSDGSLNGTISDLECSPSGPFTIDFETADKPFKGGADDLQLGQELVGYMNITLLPQATPDKIHGGLDINMDGKPLLFIPVSANIVSNFRLFPDRLTLPRYSSGETTYSSTVICRSRDNKPFEIHPNFDNTDFSVDIPNNTPPYSSIVLTINYNGTLPVSAVLTEVLSFEIRTASDEIDLQLPITIMSAPDPAG